MLKEEYDDLLRLYDDSPDTIGAWGEIVTASTLREQCEMRVLRTLYIGKSQIDMVGISQYGVFVVENKNYHGAVFGDAREAHWRVQYTPGGKSYGLYNPVMQNEVHRQAVRGLLNLMGYAKVGVYRPVIFNNGAELHLTGFNKKLLVYRLEDFVEVYRGINMGRMVSEDTCNELAELFIKFQDCSDEAKSAHLERLALDAAK